MMRLLGVDNYDILCTSVDRMARFYTEVVGMEFFLPYEEGAGWASLNAGNIRLFLIQTPLDGAPARRTSDNATNPPGLDSFAFAVPDLDEAMRELDEAAIEWAGELIEWHHPSGAWYRYRAFYDPEGNMMYVTEPHTDGARDGG
jgi:catechol 2,3-dioxygenase-like lactoylglutathione lyase family enzyme